MAEQQQFVIDREMFNELMQIRELWLARNHDEEKAGEERDQRAMGLGDGQDYHPAVYNSRFKFTGQRHH